MTGWLGSKSLDNALADEGCGCKKILEARSKADPAEAMVLKEVGESQARAWKCPLVCGGKPDASNLKEKHLEAFRAIKRMTRLPIIEEDEEGNVDVIFETCPRYYYDPKTQSGRDAKRIETAMKWKQDGQFSEVEEPTHKMIQAIELLEQSYAAVDLHNAEKQAKASEERYERYLNPKKDEEVM